VKLGCVKTDGPVPFADAFDRVQSAISRRVPNPLWPLEKLFCLGTEANISQDCETINSLVRKVVLAANVENMMIDLSFLSTFAQKQNNLNVNRL
jgi:hypothetical protein